MLYIRSCSGRIPDIFDTRLSACEVKRGELTLTVDGVLLPAVLVSAEVRVWLARSSVRPRRDFGGPDFGAVFRGADAQVGDGCGRRRVAAGAGFNTGDFASGREGAPGAQRGPGVLHQ